MTLEESLPTLPSPTCGAVIEFGPGGLWPTRAVWTAYSADDMRAYAAACVAAERERCAKACESMSARFYGGEPGNYWKLAPTQLDCAAAIRAGVEP